MKKEISNNRVLGYYEVTYHSDNITQKKQLIKKSDWDDILKPILKIISIIEDNNKGKQNDLSKSLKESLKIMFDDYNVCFPEGSPLHLSIKTGILSMGNFGDYKVSWKLLKH